MQSSYKKNLFPLIDNNQRAQSHSDDLSLEESLFIHPETENPEEHIEFLRDKPRAINGSIKGKMTIEKTGLDRPFLDEGRNQHYQKCKIIYQMIPLLPSDSTVRQEAIVYLDEAAQDTAEFASMIRCALHNGFRY
jgi:hypothetical protein